jgi:ubiquinone/menaquinone biosynthesis C-methylase UbiE
MGSLESLVVNSRLAYWFHRYIGFVKHVPPARDVGDSILEIGSGVGYTAALLADAFPHAHIVATDFLPTQIAKAQERNRHPRIKFCVEDATSLHFTDERFDACFAIFVFHHIANWRDAVREAHRVLRRNGRFYVYEFPPKAANPFHRLWPLGTPGVFSKREFEAAVRAAGFLNVRATGWYPFWLEARA